MQEEKKKWLEWVFEFIGLDLGQISLGEKVKWAIELATGIGSPRFYFCAPGAPPDDTFSEKLAGWFTDPEKSQFVDDLKPFQSCLLNFIESIMRGMGQTKATVEKGWVNEELNMTPEYQRFDIPEITVRLRPEGLMRMRRGKLGENGQEENHYMLLPRPTDRVVLRVSFETASREHVLLFNMARILDGVPIEVFHRCNECGKWFLHFTKRKRDFCSNPCASRFGVRRRRNENKTEDPEGYEAQLEANAERAHEYYAKGVKSGKPARRPYKYKK